MNFLKTLQIQAQNAGVSTGAAWIKSKAENIQSFSPVDGKLIGSVMSADKKSYEEVIKTAQKAYQVWRLWPAPKRGEVVRQMGDALRKEKQALKSREV